MESDKPEVEIISLEFDAKTIAETWPKSDPRQNPILLGYLMLKYLRLAEADRKNFWAKLMKQLYVVITNTNILLFSITLSTF